MEKMDLSKREIEDRVRKVLDGLHKVNKLLEKRPQTKEDKIEMRGHLSDCEDLLLLLLFHLTTE